jgi:hypothetical protein
MNDFVERRNNSHLQMLVEVGIRLRHFQGKAYALEILKGPRPGRHHRTRTGRPTLQSTKRHVRHVSYATVATAESMISIDR